MTTRLQSLAIVASLLLITTSGIAAEPRTEPPAQDVTARAPRQLRNVYQVRREAAMQEYAARIAEFKSGRSPVNVVLQSNRRLLHASLATGSPNAAIEYDRRASEIEACAQKNLKLGMGTKQEVAQAKSARLDAMLKDLLIRVDSSSN